MLKRNSIIILAVALWIPAVGYGIDVLWKYSTTPGRAASAPPSWPKDAGERVPGKFELVMFAHPQCPCTAASLDEMAVFLAHAAGKVDVQVYFFKPSAEPDSWAKSDTWKTASAMPGVHAFIDPDAAMAQKFGAFTSGQTMLYDSQGQLLFKGGLTAFRGHSGDNTGLSLVTALVNGQRPSASDLPLQTRVFGCTLQGE